MRVDPDLSGSKRVHLGQYRDYQHETMVQKTEGLSADQLARTHPPSDLREALDGRVGE